MSRGHHCRAANRHSLELFIAIGIAIGIGIGICIFRTNTLCCLACTQTIREVIHQQPNLC